MFFNKKNIVPLLLFFILPFLDCVLISAAEDHDQQTNSASETQGLNLFDCYRLALKQSETLSIEQELIKESDGRFRQALSGILPQVTFSTSQEWQDRGGSSNASSEIPESKFVFSQPLFSGFKEFAAMAASRAERRQREAQKIRAQQLLFKDVSDAFYFLLAYQEDLEALKVIQTVLTDRLEELNKRVHLGRSRKSEVAGAEVRLRRLEAEIELVNSQKEVARQLMEFLTGQEVVHIEDSADIQTDLSDENDYLAKAVERADVRAAKEAWMMAQKEVLVAYAGYWPAVSLDGNYYTKRTGSSKNIDWDITLKVEIPIFKGTETSGAVKVEKAQLAQAKLQLDLAKRKAEQDIKNSYVSLKTAWKRKEALAKAVTAAEDNYRYQKEDYNNNLVNNLDVLDSLQELQDTQRDFIAAHNEFNRDYWNFQVSLGAIDRDTF